MTTPKKRPVYVAQKRTGIKVVSQDGKLVEAVIIIGMRQSRSSAEKLLSGQEGAEVVKMFISAE